jgi:hypothetical protein
MHANKLSDWAGNFQKKSSGKPGLTACRVQCKKGQQDQGVRREQKQLMDVTVFDTGSRSAISMIDKKSPLLRERENR